MVLVAEVDLLHVPAPAQVPEVQLVAVLAAEQQLADHAVLDHRRGAPLAGHRDVLGDVPPQVVGQILRTAVDLPPAEHLERLVVQQRDTAGPLLAVRAAEAGQVDALRSTVEGVRPGVAGPLGQLLGLQHLDHRRLARVLFGVQDHDPGRAQPGHHQVAALGVRVRRVRTERGRAHVPAEVVQLVARVRHVGPADHLPVRRRVGVDVEHGQRVRLLGGPVEGDDVGQRLARAGRGVAGGRVERRVGGPQRHEGLLGVVDAGIRSPDRTRW